MLGLSWTELLVVGVVALIVIGPKDLPVVMGRIGKVVGQIQRMGREFQREINKTTGLDEVRNLRSSITDPLRKTADDIRKEFNAIGKDGQAKPSGALKPTDPKVESVADAIKQQAGMTPVKKTNDEIAAEAGFKPSVAAKPTVAAKPAKASAAKAPRPKAAAADKAAEPVKAARPRAARAAATSKTEAAPVAASKANPKPSGKAAATAKPADETAPAPKKPRAPRKKTAATAGKS